LKESRFWRVEDSEFNEEAPVDPSPQPSPSRRRRPTFVGGGEGVIFAVTGKHIRAAGLRQRQTDAERRMWMLLRDRRLAHLKFRRQLPIGNYIVDLICLAKGLIIELDGGQHNDNPGDAKRTTWLESRGYKVIRFWNNDVLKNREGVLTTILLALKRTPSPPEGEGRGEGSTGPSVKDSL
jgi:very-short-patch-repair endonuclease